MTKEKSQRDRWVWLVLYSALAVCVVLEFLRLRECVEQPGGWVNWLLVFDLRTTLPTFALLVILFVALAKGPGHQAATTPEATDRSSDKAWQNILLALALCAASVFACNRIGAQEVEIPLPEQTWRTQLVNLPPAYHDEYSYLLQADTFKSGRLAWPANDVEPNLFHQIHVLNQPTTSSRYFPATGAWIAITSVLPQPQYGHWLAGALATVFFFLSLLSCLKKPTAIAAGFLIAVSPGIALFGNLVLAHHPTLLALSIFTWAFFHMMKAPRLSWGLVAGCGLTAAMLARPMTAAGFALPFGAWLLVALVKNQQPRSLIVGFAIPLVCGFAMLGLLNQQTTGSWKKTAYQLYTDEYTPSHGYGFGNADTERPSAGPPALQKYDDWAENLTPKVAARNVWNRLRYCFHWSAGIVPLSVGWLLAIPLLWGVRAEPDDGAEAEAASQASIRRTQIRLLAASAVSLHVAHIPYWFDGIMHWHYVFESAPAVIAIACLGLERLADAFRSRLGKAASVPGALLVAAAMVPIWIDLPFINPNEDLVSNQVLQQAFSRKRLGYFQRLINGPLVNQPALVFVDERNSDPQLSYIINPPDLQADSLVCRLPGSPEAIDRLRLAYGDRDWYLFDPQTMQLSEFSGDLEGL